MRKRSIFIITALLTLSISLNTLLADVIRIGYTQDAKNLDPANHRSRITEGIIRNMYDGIMARDSKMNLWPELAESFKQLNDTTYEAKLRKGVKFHDGTEMTAEDVKFTFDRLTKENAMDGQTSPRKSLLGPLMETTIANKYTVRFKLKNAWPVFPRYLPFQEIVSKSFVERVRTDGLATQVNGTGPFKLVEWRKGDSIIMERFEGYYGGATGIPPVGGAKVDRVIFKIIPDSSARVAALLAGQVDLINELPVHAMKRVEKNPNTKVLKTLGTRSFFIILNNTQPPFDNVLVRRAANLSINRKLIIDKLMNGLAVPLNGILSPQSFGFNNNLPELKYDLDQAKELMHQAGYSNGVDVILDSEAQFKDISEALASQLSKVGIRAKVQIGERNTIRADWVPKKEKKRDMYFSSWGSGALDPAGIFVPNLKTNARGNRSGYSNLVVDHSFTKADAEPNQEKRAEHFRQAQDIVAKDLPLLFLWLPQDIYGASKRLKGWEPSGRGIIKLHDAYLQ